MIDYLYVTCVFLLFVAELFILVKFVIFNDKPRRPTIKLPCNIGDAVWFDTYSGRGINEGLKPHEVLDFKVYAVVSSDRGYPCDIDISEFGKTVFLTKKGADTNEK